MIFIAPLPNSHSSHPAASAVRSVIHKICWKEKCELEKGWVIIKRLYRIWRLQQSDHRAHARMLMINGREDELAHSWESVLFFPSPNIFKAISHTLSKPFIPHPTTLVFVFFWPFFFFLAYSDLSNIFKFRKWCSF